MDEIVLHTYFRSSASYRVRIALGLKGLGYRSVSHHLRKGEQSTQEYLRINPQGLIPTLEIDQALLTQSLAICEYLDETRPNPPLLPREPLARVKVRAFALAIACEIHPVQNLKILRRLRRLGLDEDATNEWARNTIQEGFDACEKLLDGQPGPYCFGDQPTSADVCLVPQLANARRFGVEPRWPRLLAAEAACLALPAFQEAAPERQPDWEP